MPRPKGSNGPTAHDVLMQAIPRVCSNEIAGIPTEVLVRWANEDGLQVSVRSFERSLARQVKQGIVKAWPTFVYINGQMRKGPNAYEIEPLITAIIRPLAKRVEFELTDSNEYGDVYRITETDETYWYGDGTEGKTNADVEAEHARVIAELADLDLDTLQDTWPVNPPRVASQVYKPTPRPTVTNPRVMGSNRVHGPLQPFNELRKEWETAEAAA